ncbi:hypothetical protein [Pararhodobacter sp.]|uniref:hypothetical protein n=1 Tax=Pararhodobacter sp. TaxID=2127056 RepID=UPI002B00195A|nr:hypothetical protein [Pararhodobacter sp.]
MTRANLAGTIPGTLTAEVLRLAQAGFSRVEICQQLRGRTSYRALQATLSNLTRRGHMMPPARPYRRYGAELRHMIRAGVPFEDAARALGVTRQTVDGAVNSYRTKGQICPAVTLSMDGALWAVLAERAQAMGEPPIGLANRLLETIARDDLFSAVIDDGEGGDA